MKTRYPQLFIWIFGGVLALILIMLPGSTHALIETASITKRRPETGLGAMRESHAPLATGTITGTVTDASGTPLEGAWVSAGDYSALLACGQASYGQNTGSDGTYQLEVPEGTYLVFGNSHNWPGSYIPEAYQDVNSWAAIETATAVTVNAGKVISNVNLSLPEGYTLSGKLVDTGGQPVLGAGGFIQNLTTQISYGCALGFSSDNSDGTFRVNAPEDTYELGFCYEDTCHTVLRNRTITESVDLGDVIFAEAPETEGPQVLEPGYTVEWFVAPSALNMPQEILLTPDDRILVLAVRSGTLFELGAGGIVTPVTSNVLGYQGDIDNAGTIYLHSHPAGEITRIAPDGTTTVLVEDPRLFSACDSGFALGPDGKLYLARNRCEETSALFEISMAGAITQRATGLRPFNTLHTTTDGRVLAADGHEIYVLDLGDYSATELSRLPTCCISPAGLASDGAGNIYAATGARKASGALYRINPAGAVSKVTDIADNGISGIEWRASTGEIIGGQLRQGGVLAIKPDGTLRTLVPGNGLITPMGIAFSPEGQLAVTNDDGGMMARVDPQGNVQWMFDYLSFTPPMPFVLYTGDGTLYASEGCPGFTHDVLALPPGASTPETFIDSDWPSGMALTPDSALLVAETVAGRIIRAEPDGTKTTFATDLPFPQALAYSSAGELYAVTGAGGTSMLNGFPAPLDGNAIVHLSEQGTAVTLTQIANVGALVARSEGGLFAATGGGVARVDSDGTVHPFATGFRHALGLAFDLAGRLYVSDAHLNGIARIDGFPQAMLQGTVSSADSGPLPGAQVQILAVQPYVVGTTLSTAAGGDYSQAVAPRTYTVTAWAQDYLPVAKQVTLSANETISISFTLERGRRVYLPLLLRN